MFVSHVRVLMGKKKKTIRGIAAETDLAVGTVHRATRDATIGGCQLNTLAKIAGALGVTTKRLYEETDDEEGLPAQGASAEDAGADPSRARGSGPTPR